MSESRRLIRAVFDDRTIRVYQAYSDQIADAALAAGTFVPPFGMRRMTWIKPSFCWMMYRSGFGGKDPNQRRILAIDMLREGFDQALRNSSPSHGPGLDTSKPVRVQWDPDRDVHLQRRPWRAIQVGLRDEAVTRYVDDWIVAITDVTEFAHLLRDTRDPALLPDERIMPVSAAAARCAGVGVVDDAEG